jgi:hypothetical protein
VLTAVTAVTARTNQWPPALTSCDAYCDHIQLPLIAIGSCSFPLNAYFTDCASIESLASSERVTQESSADRETLSLRLMEPSRSL